MSQARGSSSPQACRGCSPGTCCQRSRPGLQEWVPGYAAERGTLSLVLARREWLREVALAVSRSSQPVPG